MNASTYTLPSGVSRKQIGSNEAFAHEIQDVISAFLEDESALCFVPSASAFVFKYWRIAPDSKTMTLSSSVKQGICRNGCGLAAKSPMERGRLISYAPQFTRGDLWQVAKWWNEESVRKRSRSIIFVNRFSILLESFLEILDRNELIMVYNKEGDWK